MPANSLVVLDRAGPLRVLPMGLDGTVEVLWIAGLGIVAFVVLVIVLA